MLRRKALEQFEFWKHNKTKQALLVVGARQVGKTFLIREFARKNYDNFIEFNLIENAAARNSFKAASSADDLMLRISVASPSPLIPGKTLLFFDEVQECPEVATSIKFLVDKGEFDYVLSGSMLGVELENISSLPVGYVTEVSMYPLDFEEFCWAAGLGGTPIKLAKDCFTVREAIPDYLHERLTALFHRYLLVGGMPDAVVAFTETNSIDQVRALHEGITTFYARDISKYAPRNRRLTIKNIFDLIPSELSEQNKRFKLSSIENVKRYTQVQEEFHWLTKANVALAAYKVRAPISPLLLAENHSLFKLFLSDVGLLASRFPKESLLGIIDGRPAKHLGGLYENFVAQELAAHGFDLRYYTGKKVGELDFVVERKDGALIVLEVKSGAGYRSHAALNNALAIKEFDISEAIVLAETNISQAGSVLYLPIYMVSVL